MFRKILLIVLNTVLLSAVCYAQGTNSLTVTTYYPSPYGIYKTLKLEPRSSPGLPCQEGELYYDSGTGIPSKGLYYCAEESPSSGNFIWKLISGGGGGVSQWTQNSGNLYTNDSSGGSRWNVGIGTTASNAELQVIGAISRQGTTLYGNPDAIATHVNLGVNSFTGKSDTDRWYCTVSGGLNNTASGDYSTVSGGENNTASGIASVVSGGKDNTASGGYSVVSGGESNNAIGDYSVVSGGKSNNAIGGYSVVSGGLSNSASGNYSIVPGGAYNEATGDYSFAAGYYAKAKDASGNPHKGAFVWADSSSVNPYYSNGPDTFNVRASGGAYLLTTVADLLWKPYDVAEFMDVLKSDAIQETELVALKENHKLAKTTTAYDKNLIGVISSKKTTTLHLGNSEASFQDTERKPVALAGPVFVKVNNQNGKIKLGDPITSSDTPGIGMKATKPGKIVGYAMQEENFNNVSLKEIPVFINVGYYLPEETSEELEDLGVDKVKQELKTLKQQLSKLNK